MTSTSTTGDSDKDVQSALHVTTNASVPMFHFGGASHMNKDANDNDSDNDDAGNNEDKREKDKSTLFVFQPQTMPGSPVLKLPTTNAMTSGSAPSTSKNRSRRGRTATARHTRRSLENQPPPPLFREEVMQWLIEDLQTASSAQSIAMVCALQSALEPEAKKNSEDEATENEEAEKEDKTKDSQEGAPTAAAAPPYPNPPPLDPSFSWQAKVIWTFLYGKHAKVSPSRSPQELARCQERSLQRTPLHIAAYYGAEEDAIRLLLDVYPEGACLLDRRGHSPLQLVFYGATLAAAAVNPTKAGDDNSDAKPAAAATTTTTTSSPPPVFIRRSVVEALLHAHPAAVTEDTSCNATLQVITPQKKFGVGQNLLHLAATHSGSCEMGVLELILRADPDAAFAEDSLGRTPLQILLSTPLMCTPQAMTFIEKALFANDTAEDFRKRLVDTRDVRGQTPLHSVVNNGLPIELVRLLLEWFPAVSLDLELEGDKASNVVQDANSYTPLHLAFLGDAAIQSGAIRTDLVETLLSTHPALATLATKQEEKTPLHLMATHIQDCQDFSLLATVFSAHPQAALQTDSLGRMPLHILMANVPHCLVPEKQAALLPVIRNTLLGNKKNESDEGVVDAQEVAAGLDSNGRTPLHLAVYYGAGMEWIQLLLEVYPQATMKKDKRGNLPLSMVLKRAAGRGGRDAQDVQVVTALLQVNPKAAQEPLDANSQEFLLHLAADYSHECGVEIMELFLQANPFATLCRDARGRTPLHILVGEASTTSTKRENRKSSLKAKGRGGNSDSERVDEGGMKERLLRQAKLLLQETKAMVTLAKPPLDDKQTKTDAEEEKPRSVVTTAAALVDNDGLTPLHLATLNKECPAEVLEALLTAFPASVSIRDRWGRLPLHLAVSHKLVRQSMDRLKILLEANPQASYEKDALGRTPLFVVLAKPLENSSMFDLVFEANTEAAKIPDTAGVTPLMKALQWRSDSEANDEKLLHVVQAIVDKCPEAVTASGGSEMVETPLQLAIKNRRNPDMIQLLLEQDPEAAAKRHGMSTPLSIAASQQDVAVVNMILAQCPQAAQTLLAHDACALHEAASKAIIEAVFDAWPQGILQKECTQGRTPLHKWMENVELAVLAKSLVVQHIMRNKHGEEAMRVTDNLGLAPLHFALFPYARRASIGRKNLQAVCQAHHCRTLMQAYPEALFIQIGNEAVSGNDDSPPILKLFRGTSIVGLVCQLRESDAVSALADLFEVLWPLNESNFGFHEDKSKESGVKTSDDDDDSNDDDDGGDSLTAWALRKVCEQSNQPDIVKAIQVLQIRFPKAVRSMSPQKQLALHVACTQSKCAIAVVEQLTEIYGAALTVQDGHGRVPLTVACWNDAPLDVLYHLLRSAPDVLLGMSPLKGEEVA